MNLLRILLLTFLTLFFFSCKEPLPRPVIRIIPQPAEVTEQDGLFIITPATKIIISDNNRQASTIAGFLSAHIEKYFGILNTIVVTGKEEEKSIVLRINEKLKIGKEDYTLNVLPSGIIIEAAALNGLFYGVQTLLQLMPPTPKALTEIILPAVAIKDNPRFAWRGLQLDVSRHFMPKTFILKYLDEMAMHKFNIFQWHLSDDQGWRVEIRKYPRLTEIGSVRKQTIIGHINNPAGIDTVASTGYYSQNDIREIVSYASERYITILPAIEMPGHALAALASYPELGCTSTAYEVATRWGIFSDVLCPGKESTYTFIKDVMGEMSQLFPGKYIHFGGAESPQGRWEKCPDCQLRIRRDTLESTQGLHNYFVKRVSNILDSLGKQSVVWDENMKDTSVAKGAIISWHNGDESIKAARLKIKTIQSPVKYCNFDQYQANPSKEPLAVGGLLTLEQVYDFDPVPVTLSVQDAKNIIGAQANIWTPYMKTPLFVEYMTFPRAAALAEVVWSPKGVRNYTWFKRRLLVQLKRYDSEGITYCKAEFKSLTN